MDSDLATEDFSIPSVRSRFYHALQTMISIATVTTAITITEVNTKVSNLLYVILISNQYVAGAITTGNHMQVTHAHGVLILLVHCHFHWHGTRKVLQEFNQIAHGNHIPRIIHFLSFIVYHRINYTRIPRNGKRHHRITHWEY